MGEVVAGGFPSLTEGKPGKFYRPGPEARVDTVGISVAVSDWNTTGCTASVRDLGGTREAWKYLRKLEGGGFLGTGVGGRAWMEASLPKRRGASNVEPVRLEEAIVELEGLWDEAAEHLTLVPGETLLGARVKRLDMVRDVDAGRGMGVWLDGMARAERGGRLKVRRWQDVERNRAETLMVGPLKAWVCYAYDKHAETAGEAAPGHMRIESRMRAGLLSSAWATRHGGQVKQVGDLDEDRLRRYTRGMFTRVAFDRKVAAMGHVVDEALGCEELSEAERAMFLAYLVASAYGRQLRLADKTVRKYRSVARRLGLTVGAPVDEGAYTMRVDFEQAAMLVEAA